MAANDLTGNVIEPELGLHILSELADLNADFIELMANPGHAAGLLAMLPTEQIEQLQQLSKPAIRRLTSCAFALFDLHLQDADLWRSLSSGKTPVEFAGATHEVPQGMTHGTTEGTTDYTRLFSLAALMYLRHLADINRFIAKLSFGASATALEVISDLPLSRIREIAEKYPLLLRSRFGSHPGAWTELLKLAKRNDTEPMLPAKILGYKHLYQE